MPRVCHASAFATTEIYHCYSTHPAQYGMLYDFDEELLLPVHLQSKETLHFPYSGSVLAPSIVIQIEQATSASDLGLAIERNCGGQ